MGIGTHWLDTPNESQFHRAEFSRRGSKWTLSLDGKNTEADFYNTSTRDWPGHWGISIVKGETAEITYFSLRRM